MPALNNNTAARRYLDLLRHALCRDRFPDARYDMSTGSLKLMPFDPALRAQGRDWPLEPVTMGGTKRLENLENCCCTALEEGIPGDFVETGVWRGGCGILMRAILAATGDETRKVWLFDSFAGLPKPDVKNYPQDEPDRLWTFNEFLGVSLARKQISSALIFWMKERDSWKAGFGTRFRRRRWIPSRSCGWTATSMNRPGWS